MLRIRQPALQAAEQTIALDRTESSAQIFLPTVTQVGAVQIITLDIVSSTAQVFLPTISVVGEVLDTSDILDRYRIKRSQSKEEEEIAALLLKARQKRPIVEKKHKKLINWRQLIYKRIYGAQTIEELENIQISKVPSDSPEVVEALLNELREQKQLRKVELKLKMEEAALAASKYENEIVDKLKEQKKLIDEIKTLYAQTLERFEIAAKSAREAEMAAFIELQKAEQAAQKFAQKRNNRIKRIKTLMWLSTLDL